MQLSKRAAQLFSDPAKPPAIASLRERHGIVALPVKEEEALYLPRIPSLHRDPFDRMLVCQAVVNGMAPLTPDPLIVQYPVRAIW